MAEEIVLNLETTPREISIAMFSAEVEAAVAAWMDDHPEALNEEYPNLFYPGTGSGWDRATAGAQASADEDGTLITFSGQTATALAQIPIMGKSDYTTVNLPAGTYYFGREQVTGSYMFGFVVNGTSYNNEVVTLAEPAAVRLRSGQNRDYTGCSARYWIVAADHKVPWVPHSKRSAIDLLARAEAKDLRTYIDEQIAGVMLAIANL